MSRILFVGDPHFDSQTPISRLDNYRETSLKKLDMLYNICLLRGANYVMFTGDFFDKYEISFSYLNELAAVLTKFKNSNIKVMSLIGNHDLPYNNMAYFKNTPLSFLFKSGLISHIEETNNLGAFTVYGIDFTNMESAKKLNMAAAENQGILIAHYAVDNTVPGESLDLKDLNNFKVIVSGHDHMFYQVKELDNGTKVLRPGSLLRRTKDEYNLTRDVIVYLVEPVYHHELESSSIKKFNVEEIKLSGIKPASEIFKNEVFAEAQLNLYDNKYNDLFNKEYFESEANNIIEILNVLPVTVLKESKDAVIKYLKDAGISI